MNRLFLILSLTCLACGVQSAALSAALPTDTTMPAVDTKQALPAISTPTPSCLMVTAENAVYLREMPTTDNYPIMPLEHGVQVAVLGVRKHGWYFVALGELLGWVYGAYLGACP